jgi:Ca2+/Na+ antiporter
MILQVLRILVLVVLIFSIMVDIEIPVILHTQVNQLIIAIIIIAIILLVDEIIGFLLGLLFLIIYFKYYQKLIKNNQVELKEPLINNRNDFRNENAENFNTDVKPTPKEKTTEITEHYIRYTNDGIEMPYISNELLEKAQTNIYDMTNYNNEIRIDNNTYGVQGLNSDGIHYPAFEPLFVNYNKL